MIIKLIKLFNWGIFLFISFLLIACDDVVNDSGIVEPEPTYPNRIDAITSASEEKGTNNIQIDSGFAYDTFAILYTYYSDSHDEHFLTFGLDSTKMNDTVPIALWPRTSICTLSNLLPSTTYFIQFRGQFSTNPTEENHEAWGNFTTTKLSSHF